MRRVALTALFSAMLAGCSASTGLDDASKSDDNADPPAPKPIQPTDHAKSQKSFARNKKKSNDGQPKPLIVKAPVEAPAGMIWIAGGGFTMGDERGAPDKDPKYKDVIPEHFDAMIEHRVELDGFYMDQTEVTNRQFKAFVDATKYVTTAEKRVDLQKLYAQVGKKLPQGKQRFKPACSVCYNRKMDPSKVDKKGQLDPSWIYKSKIWTYVEGADWRHPEGPKSSIKNLMDHPVVHVSWDDAMAYCKWAGKQLPTEAQWEYAARGGLKRQRYPWGDELKPGGRWQANIWQGKFPIEDKGEDGYKGTAPVKSFKPNGYGLYEMAGNVWEWCADWHHPLYYKVSPLRNPTGPDEPFIGPSNPTKMRVQRGGSFMCSDNYCIGYSVAARMKGEQDNGAFHTGFRCVINADRIDEYRKAPARKLGH